MFGPALVALFALLFASLSGAEAQAPAPAAAEMEALVSIPPVKGEWGFESRGMNSRFERTHALYYRAPAFPNLSLDLVRIECSFGGYQRSQVKGMIPAQSFPQPRITLSLGSRAWHAVPNALYRSRSQPHGWPAGMPKGKFKGETMWPGHPAYAELDFSPPHDPALLDGLASGQSLWVEFQGQRHEYPAPPADVAARYRQACASLYPPGFPGIG